MKSNFNEIKNLTVKLEKLKVLVIGDTIIDQYIFVTPKGRAIKDPIMSTEYENYETYAGGTVVIANHISTFVKKIKLVTIIGDRKNKLDFIKKNLNKNIKLKHFVKKNSPTTVKKRFIDSYRNNKLFKIEYINDKPILDKLTREIMSYLNKELPKYDLVIVGDFGHGFINNGIRGVLEKRSKFLSINVQSNSANMGYNYINHYRKVDFITMNDSELRLPLMKRFEPIEDVMTIFSKKFGYDKFLVTLGDKGSVFFDNGKLYKCPVLVKSVVDTVGAGDALFAIASLFTYIKANPKLIPFVANCAGGIKANYMGNKYFITKNKLLKFINEYTK